VAYIDTENIPSPRNTQNQKGGRGTPDDDSFLPRNRTKDRHKPELLRQYSVLLVKGEGSTVLERYRVRLPINVESGTGVICGEGKPENQNHAIIFCHSETVQTIDCNQDGYLAEALKLPNLLGEFKKHSRVKQSTPLGPALVGFREWVFSEDSGALAEFAAATERSFGTTVQRVMHNPGGVRFHYGHPDVWDKQFTMTNGGVSKSNKGLHVSEDVFGGYNVMLRGRDITYVDYHSVGKGRDMGFETINGFESKVS
jgi:1,3-beta-glucan synthase